MNLNSRFFGKLYDKKLFKGITYPEVSHHDDFMTNYKLYDKATKVVDIKVDKYCIVTIKDKYNKALSDKDRMKKMDACLEMLEYVEEHHPRMANYCKIKVCYEAIDLFKRVTTVEYKRQLYSYIKLYRRYALKDKRFDFKKKALCIRSLLGCNLMRLSFFLEKSV